MKLQDQLPNLRKALLIHDTHGLRTLYRARKCTAMRYRWDLLWCAVDAGHFDIGTLYRAGANDEHIDTLLRKAVPHL